MDQISTIVNKYIDSPSYVWVPIVTFVFVALIAALIGWINGWKTSLYFMGWNLVGLIVSVLVAPSITHVLGRIDLFKAIIDSIQEWIGVVIIFLFLLVMNFLGFCFYWIFRRRLKRSMKNNKKAGISNMSSRFIGLGIAVTSSMPAAVMLSETGAVMSQENRYTTFLDTLTKGFTGGKYHGSKDARILIKNISNLADLFQSISGGGAGALIGKDGKITPAAKVGLTALLKSDFSGSIDDIYNGVKSSGLIDDIDVSGVSIDDIKKNMPHLDLPEPTPKRRGQLENSLRSILGGADQQAKVDAIFDKLFGNH